MNRTVGLLALVALLSALSCARVGRQFDPALVDAVEVNKTTKAEVEMWFGAPYSVSNSVDANNNAVLTYTYVYARAAAFRRTTSQACVFSFDTNGVVVAKSVSGN